MLDLEPAQDGEVVVLELSSYQTDLARALTPDVAVFTNLSPDHLDRHGGLGGYFAAKRRLFAEGGPDRAVIGVDEDEGRYLANQLSEGPGDDRVIRGVRPGKSWRRRRWSVFARKGFLAEWRKGRQVASIDLRADQGLPGAHNHQNACAAWAVARSLGLGARAIEAAIHSYPGLPHRSQRIAEKDGVRLRQRLKATNVDSAAKALQAFDRIRWICRGLEKEGGLARPGARTSGRWRRPIVIGHEARDLCPAARRDAPEICTTMARAVEPAVAEAAAGRNGAAGARRRQLRPVRQFREARRAFHRTGESGGFPLTASGAGGFQPPRPQAASPPRIFRPR